MDEDCGRFWELLQARIEIVFVEGVQAEHPGDGVMFGLTPLICVRPSKGETRLPFPNIAPFDIAWRVL